MCGIVGIISKNLIDKDYIESMTDVIDHRGPDGFGYYFDDNIVFGHRRLSIVDLSDWGKQPMEYLDRYVITFNGEIYNHIEIKEELIQKGYKFKSDTDTEVIMASYDLWGKDCLSYFNGMWAFTIFDKYKNIFFISRDRFGKKPLFYYKDKENFIFASEIKSILANPIVKKETNLDFINNYYESYTKEYIKETSFENIYRFDFSSYFEGSLNDLFDSFKTTKFWEIKPNLIHEAFDEEKAKKYAEKYYNLLEDAVRIRLRADVKVGSALSGGLDSSSIVYIVNKLLKEEKKEELQETFSSVYKSTGTEDCDESIFIDIMAEKFSVHSNQIEPQEIDIPEEYEKMIWHLENPPENSLMSSWYTFKLVSSTNVKVTLDGQGADEQLSGYFHYILSYMSSLSLLDLISETRHCLKIPNAKKYVLVGLFFGLLRLSLGEKILKKIAKLILKREFEPNLNQKLVDDINTSLITLIHYADRTSMAFSIESRMPFMDYRLVEFLSQVPASYKMRNGWTKYLARIAFDGKLPDEITWRKDKMGWKIPEKKWFDGKLKKWFEEQISTCSICANLKTTNTSFSSKIKLLNLSIYEKLFLRDFK